MIDCLADDAMGVDGWSYLREWLYFIIFVLERSFSPQKSTLN